jgi:prophage DNA circulation protein
MAIPPGFQRAQLEVEGGDTIKCAFNPTDYTISKTNVWTYKPATGQDLPNPEFGGGLPQRYQLQLLLDSTLGVDSDHPSVTDTANKLMKMMHTEGAVKLPKAAPVSIAIKYVLFQPTGEPTRAMIDLELAQADKQSTASGPSAGQGQNPTTRAMRGLRVHKVLDGDTLPSIAHQHYADPTQWRVVAETNGIDDPFRLRRGTELTIPRLEDV